MPAKAVVKSKPAAKAAGKASGKKAAPKGKKKVDTAPKTDPRCVRPKKIFSIGGDLPPKRKADLTRFVRWPKYVWRQRRIRVLQNRLKIPAPVNQFAKTLSTKERQAVLTFAAKYKPESKKERAQRHKALASKTKDQAAPPKKATLRCGLKCVTRLIEQKRAKLVLIAHDVTPLETVLWLPALCRKQDIPYAIVKNKALLGDLAGFKQATCLAFDKINPDDNASFSKLIESIKTGYLAQIEETRTRAGGLKLGRVSRDRLKARELSAKNTGAAAKRATGA